MVVRLYQQSGARFFFLYRREQSLFRSSIIRPYPLQVRPLFRSRELRERRYLFGDKISRLTQILYLKGKLQVVAHTCYLIQPRETSER